MKSNHIIQLSKTIDKLDKHDIVSISGEFFYIRKLDKHDLEVFIDKIEKEEYM